MLKFSFDFDELTEQLRFESFDLKLPKDYTPRI